MELSLPVGTYVVAVSGGVDSVVLLDMLAKLWKLETSNLKLEKDSSFRFVVAHFDHGIRTDSKLDRQLVRDLTHHYRLPFVYDEGRLGPGAGEATARQARYDFLRGVRQATSARAIITAHHQDDLLETAILNLLRGTGRRGLTSLKSTDTVLRPLLHVPKAELFAYARQHNLVWRDDTTNQDIKYLRNRIRQRVMPRFTAEQRQQLLDTIQHLRHLNDQIDGRMINQLHLQPARDRLDRHWFIMLPHAVAREALAVWLRVSGIGDFDKKRLERLVQAAKAFQPGRRTDINKAYMLEVRKADLALVARER